MSLSELLTVLSMLMNPKVAYGYSVAITIFCVYLMRRHIKTQEVIDKISEQMKEDNQRYIDVLGKVERTLVLVLENSRIVTNRISDINTRHEKEKNERNENSGKDV